MYEISVHGRNRDIPWHHDGQQTHIHLIAGIPRQTDDEEMVDHIRKFHAPEEGRGIGIKEIDVKSKSVRGMTLPELQELADSKDVAYSESDSRMDIMNKLKEV